MSAPRAVIFFYRFSERSLSCYSFISFALPLSPIRAYWIGDAIERDVCWLTEQNYTARNVSIRGINGQGVQRPAAAKSQAHQR
jgi:hypothetical protein